MELQRLIDEFTTLCKELQVDFSQREDIVKGTIFCLTVTPLLESGSIDLTTYESLLKNFDAAHLNVLTGGYEKDLVLWRKIAETFSELYASVGNRPRRFFALFQDGIVAEWDSLANNLSGVFTDGKRTLSVLYIIYYFCELEKKFRADASEESPYEYYLKHKLFPSESFPYELSESAFNNTWQSIFYFHLEQMPVKLDKDIFDVIEQYKKIGNKSNEKLLTDYLTIITHGKGLPAINPWQGHRRRQNKPHIESGLMIDEALFDYGFARNISKYKPTEMVQALFYQPIKRNNFAFEVCVLINLFVSKIKPDDAVCLVNPSPAMLTRLDSVRRGLQAKSITCIVNDKIVAAVYTAQFPEMQFVPLAASNDNIPLFDVMLVTTRDWDDKSHLNQVFRWATHTNENAPILALVHRKIVNDRSYIAEKQRLMDAFSIQRVINVDNKSLNDPAQKKMLLFLKSGAVLPIDEQNIMIQNDEFTGTSIRFRNECATVVSAKLLYDSITTTNALLKKALSTPQQPREIVRRDSAKEAHFSKEITLQYTSWVRQNAVVGKAYYCTILPEGIRTTRQRGKRLTDFIERGLRCDSEETLHSKVLTMVPYDDAIEPYVIRDVLQHYSERKNTLSLKTIWYCNRPELFGKIGYRDDFAKEIFGHPAADNLANLIPNQATIEDYEKAVEPIVNSTSANECLPVWNQLYIILNCAQKAGFILLNPLREQLRALDKRASKELQEVRAALTKKTFTLEQERKLLAIVTRNNQYIYESIWLIVLIRFYTGLSVQEICALTWKDFSAPNWHITHYACFYITKIMKLDGRITRNVLNPEKLFRKAAVVMELAYALLERKQYLLEVKKITPSILADMPIILASENKPHEFCRIHTANKKCGEVIDALGIPPNIVSFPDEESGYITTDLSNYPGDIFRSNFRYRANHICKLTDGDIHNALGLGPPDTYSKHYCDYLNDGIQQGIIDKLHRWTAKHNSALTRKCSIEKEIIDTNAYHRAFSLVDAEILNLEQIIEVDPAGEDEFIDVFVSAEHGIVGDIDFCRKENVVKNEPD